jgi:hypothetical protein
MRASFFPLLILLFAGPALADDGAACRKSPKLTGPCFIVHGRLSITNGSWNYRIWPVGTHRMLAIVDESDVFDDETGPPLPGNVRRVLNGFETETFADFEVCPLTPDRPGVMRHVCLAKATNISVRIPH